MPFFYVKKNKDGKVSPELASKTYSSSKKIFYYGVKSHCFAHCKINQILLSTYITFIQASTDDSVQMLTDLYDCSILADKAYISKKSSTILKQQESILLHPEKS